MLLILKCLSLFFLLFFFKELFYFFVKWLEMSLVIESRNLTLAVQTCYVSMSLKILSCWLWVHVGGDFPSCLASFVVSVWPGRKKSTAEYYSSYKNAGLCRAGFGFPGHPVLNYSLKASAQLVEFVWIDWEAERAVAKTLELFVPRQFIQIKWPTSRTVDSSDCMFFLFFSYFDTLTGCELVLSVCDILRLCFTWAPWITMCTSGCVARPVAAVLIRAQVAHSQHIRVRLQPLQNKLLGGLIAESQDKCTGTCFQSQIEEAPAFQTTLGVYLNLLYLQCKVNL